MPNLYIFRKVSHSKSSGKWEAEAGWGTGEFQGDMRKIMDGDRLSRQSVWLPKVQVDAHPVRLIDCSARPRMSPIPSTWIQLHICFQKVLGQNTTFSPFSINWVANSQNMESGALMSRFCDHWEVSEGDGSWERRELRSVFRWALGLSLEQIWP